MTKVNARLMNADPSVRRGFGMAALILMLVAGVALGALLPRLLAGRAVVQLSEEGKPKRAVLPSGVVEVDEIAQRNAEVQLAAATSRTLPTVIEVTGVVAPEDSRVAHIRPLARGLIEDILVSLVREKA